MSAVSLPTREPVPRPSAPALSFAPPLRIAERRLQASDHPDVHAVFAAADVAVWMFPLDEAGWDDAAPHLLSAAECARARRFVFPVHRQRFVRAHIGLRRLLAACTGLAPQAVELVAGALGRPELLPPHDRWSFNLSHSDDWAAVALMPAALGQVGVDIESLVDAPRRAEELAGSVLGAEERNALQRLPASSRGPAFITAWTRKEAVLKATGWGLHIAPESLPTGVEPMPVQVRLPGPLRDLPAVQIHPLTAPDGQIATLAVMPPPSPSPLRDAAAPHLADLRHA